MKEKAMESIIRKLTKGMGKIPARDQNAALRGRNVFLNQAATLRATANTKKQNVVAAPILPTLKRQPVFIFKAAVALVIALFVLISGTALTVYAAQDSLPNQALYRVKLVSEDVLMNLAGSPQAQIANALKFSDRRVNEITALAAMGNPLLEGVMERYMNELNQAMSVAANLGDPLMQQQLEQIRVRIEAQLQILNAIDDSDSTDQPLLLQLRSRIREQIRICELGESNPQGYRQMIQERQQERNEIQAQSTSAVQAQQTPAGIPNQGNDAVPGGISVTPGDSGNQPGNAAGPNDTNSQGGTEQPGSGSGNKP